MNTIQQNQSFLDAIDQLNLEQRKAVDTIEGPVMVIAGPGTGKTQLLAARIGNILIKTDTRPDEILCMTYTEAGAYAMRKRLLEFIGPEAYNVKITTFHGFCNEVIKHNPGWFGGYNDLQIISDLEKIDLLRGMVDKFGYDHPLKRLKGNIYFEQDRMKKLFEVMKQENWTYETVKNAVDALPQYLETQDGYVAKRKTTNKNTGQVFLMGDIRTDKIAERVEKMKPILAAAKELENYNKALTAAERFDFADMILWVLNLFKSQPELLADYQEKYQYFLVDEYQDTNGAQNDLLYLLAGYWERPNLFVVGDDDQSIYRFQGANMDNILEFRKNFNPEVVILQANYRSAQLILDKITALIEHNQVRLANRTGQLTKKLVEERKGNFPKPAVDAIAYHNNVHEEADIARQIISLHESGVNLDKVAVIYRKHAQAEPIIRYLSQQNIPLNVKRAVNVLELPIIRQLMTILEYLSLEHNEMYAGDHLLFDILHISSFGNSSRDIGTLAVINRLSGEDKSKWRDIIAKEQTDHDPRISNPETIRNASDKIEGWLNSISDVTTQVLFEKILSDTGILDQALIRDDNGFDLQAINRLFNFIKEESAKNPYLTLDKLVEMIERMIENKLSLPLQISTFMRPGVHFLTAHGAKGLEFSRVFVMGCGDKKWKSGKGTSNYTYPDNLVPATQTSSIEDDRRLFYVALSRAENYLHISYPQQNMEEKVDSALQFIFETGISENEVTEKHLDDQAILSYAASQMRHIETGDILINHDLVDQALENFQMSVTALNKYLKCPISFYFENIIRVPMARIAAMGFGSAMHFAMEKLINAIERDPGRNIPDKDFLLESFKNGMNRYHSNFSQREFEDLTRYGLNCLGVYYDYHKRSLQRADRFYPEKDISLTHAEGIPITGKLDRVDIFKDHIEVIDYKTGNAKSKYALANVKPPKDEDDSGGDYWRQIVYYKMLLQGEGKINTANYQGHIDYLEPDKFGNLTKKHIEITDEDISTVTDQLKESWQKINDHVFEPGCGEEDCHWCNLVDEYKKTRDSQA